MDLSKHYPEKIQLPLADIVEGLAETAFGFSGERLLSYRYQAPDFSKPTVPTVPPKKEKSDEPSMKIPKREKIALEKTGPKDREIEKLVLEKLCFDPAKELGKPGHGVKILNIAAPSEAVFSWQQMTWFKTAKSLKVN